MFSPVKAITAGALVFAIGGALLIAQPFVQQGGDVPGAETDAVPVDPVQFTARFLPSVSLRRPTAEKVDGVIQRRGAAWAPVLSEMSDPRLDGTLTYSEDTDEFLRSGRSLEFGAVTYRIETDEGAWQGSTPILKVGLQHGSPSVVVLVGEEAYEGLYAWMDTSDWDAISGVVFPAQPPDAPTAP